MSMENELKRIADSLERIEAKMIGSSPLLTPVVGASPAIDQGPEKSKPGRKKKEVVDAPQEDDPTVATGDELEIVPTEVETMTPQGFLGYCNSKLSPIVDVKKKQELIATVKKKILGLYKVASLLEIPPAKISEAKAEFDKIMGV